MTLQVAPRYDLDGFEVAPIVFVLAGTAVAAGVGVAAWLNQKGWSVGEYNQWMRQMDATIKNWDALGWKYGCWKNADTRKAWLDFWKAFSTHYKEHGLISSVSYVSDSEEMPARNLMSQLIQWGNTLNNCGAPIAIKDISSEKAAEEQAAASETDWGSLLKWGAIGVGGLVLLNLLTGFKSAFAKQ